MKKLFTLVVMIVLVVSVNLADFDWVDDFNIKAEADLSNFKAKISAEFQVEDATVKAVLDNVKKPSDAYIIFELGKISGKSIDVVRKRYRAKRKKGWGVLARSLGIKPGSKEFHELKNGKTFYTSPSKGRSKGRGKSHKKGKGNRGRGKGRR